MLKPKKLDIFITKQFGLLFIGTFLICQFVLMMQFLWRYVDELIGKGLTLDILAQFFWYMGLMLVPQALPLAILMSSLITFGNLGESSELTAIKAAGISLMQSFRSLIVITCVISCVSFVFQNDIGPRMNIKFLQLLVSMKQTNPELEIPEGIFYDGIPESNIYVHHKDMETGKLYGVTIYRRTGSFEDQAIILADSGMMQATAEKKHLLLSLWSGEWFENMQQGDFGNSAAVPYRRESFENKEILLDFDAGFNLTDESRFRDKESTKSLRKIIADIDSMNLKYDSVGMQAYQEMRPFLFTMVVPGGSNGSSRVVPGGSNGSSRVVPGGSRVVRLEDMKPEKRGSAIITAKNEVENVKSELEFRSQMAADQEENIRYHEYEAIKKFTLSLSCLLFFFIGAPLGAIIRKGGLGLPIVVSVMVFIVFYSLDNTGMRMAKLGAWNIWLGSLLATIVLTPVACWVTYKANKDSTVFNMDMYKSASMKLLGLRVSRNIVCKEVIIEDPDYTEDSQKLEQMNSEIEEYIAVHKLRRLPNIIKVFFKYEPDNKIEELSETLESIIEDLSNTRDKYILSYLNKYPVLAVKAHTRPFEHKWMNIVSAVIIPVGAFLYIRMWRFRLRLYRDLGVIRKTNEEIIKIIYNGKTIRKSDKTSGIGNSGNVAEE